MKTLLPEFKEQISEISSIFSKKVSTHAIILLIGAVLVQGTRTVCNILRFLGMSQDKQYHKYHRVLSLAKWSAKKGSEILFRFLVNRFVKKGMPLVLGIDETLERRRGEKIEAKGVYRDAVRSSKTQLVKSTGLRWISLMLITKLSWAKRLWALPFLTVLAASEKYSEKEGKKHKTITDWAYQMIIQVKRWFVDRELVVVGDTAYSVLSFLDKVRCYASIISPLRLDAQLFDFPTVAQKSKRGPKEKKGAVQPKLEQRLDSLDTQWTEVFFSQWYGQSNITLLVATGTALWYNSNWGKIPVPLRWVLIKDPKGGTESKAILCTNLDFTPEQIMTYYTYRWSVEVTFQEVRTHLGVETQRQWSPLAIARTTPVLMALFSWVTLWADILYSYGLLRLHKTAWYQKEHLTFSDALLSVKQYLSDFLNFKTSFFYPDVHNLDALLNGFLEFKKS